MTDVAAASVGCVLVTTALILIWAARLSVHQELYVSELGAPNMPTAKTFELALILVGVGGSLVAWSGRAVRSRLRILALWTPAVSLWIASGLFLFASQVTCTDTCPPPYGDTFTWQDFFHTLAAVLAFAAACWAMLQSSFAQDHRVLRVFSASMGISVGAIAATGGIFSLLHFEVILGSRLEFVATTLAIAWLVLFGVVLAARGVRDLREARPDDAAAPSARHEVEQAIS